MRLRIQLLGPFRISVDGAPVEERQWSRPKPKLIVKLLALQTHHQLHREQLIEMLWPELAPGAAMRNLTKTIHLARRALEPGLKSGDRSRFIVTRGQQVSLTAPGELWIDAVRFEERGVEAIRGGEPGVYEEALALYEGDLLVEDLYEDWVASQREHLRGLRDDLLFRLARISEERGLYQKSVDLLKQLLGSDAANEEAHRSLMRLYATTGNRHLALQQFQLCVDALAGELSVEPDRATIELRSQIEFGQLRPQSSPGVQRSKPSQMIDSLAVLPLVNASADPKLEYLSDGITESIISSLSRLPKLRVMAFATVSRYKGRETDPQLAAREIGVRAVLSGRVQQVSDRIVIRAELIDTADGSQLWGGRYDRQVSDILAIEADISREISEKLLVRLTSEERTRLVRGSTEDIEAYHDYLKGRYYMNRWTAKWVRKASEHFQQAIDRDPAYAAAYAGLADSYILLINAEAMTPIEGLSLAKAAARKAIEIEPALAEGYTSLAHACLHTWEWSASESAFSRAVDLNPGYACAHQWYAEYLAAVGRFDDSVAEILKARELDPLSIAINSDVGATLYFARRYDEAAAELRRTIEMEPSAWAPHWLLGRTYTQMEMHEQAISETQTAMSLSGGGPLSILLIGHAYAAAGKRSEALDVIQQLKTLSAQRYFSPFRMALIPAGLGDVEEAFALLERAFEVRDARLIWLKVDPVIDSLRTDARFADLLNRVGLL